MSEHLDTTQTEANRTAERIGLPSGFVTEKGSLYRYNADGGLHRDKFDGTQSEAGIAVFIEDTPDHMAVFTLLGAIQSHQPPERQRKAYILEFEYRDGQRVPKQKVYKASQVSDPSNLAFAFINQAGQILKWMPVTIEPQLGSYVFEMDKLPNGDTVRHPGHRVTDIVQ